MFTRASCHNPESNLLVFNLFLLNIKSSERNRSENAKQHSPEGVALVDVGQSFCFLLLVLIMLSCCLVDDE